MKNIITLFSILFITSAALAQDVKKDTYYLDGDLIEVTIYHDNGAVAQTGHYNKQNKLQGEWVSYDLNGTRTAVAQYNNGKKVGTWYFYQGDTLKEVSYDDSTIAAVKTYKKTDTQIVSN